ncbi:3'-5' exonuclease [Pseudomonas paralactis]|uniref:3'-5' exonuclease n=1 Tax=Pseudomonas paralactis TaxID=1615673 RepID=UPI0023572320|nr:3'-5' exonuclease [Pseudomonas paralactis]
MNLSATWRWRVFLSSSHTVLFFEYQNGVRGSSHACSSPSFQAVIMLELEEGVVPSKYVKTADAYEEAARLFYVGVTRAKAQVHLAFDRVESPFITTIRTAT